MLISAKPLEQCLAHGKPIVSDSEDVYDDDDGGDDDNYCCYSLAF